MIDFYTAATPNGYKVAIMLEEVGAEYNPHLLDLGQQDQKLPGYLAINPNGRIPTIVDRDNGDFAVFESGAILLYLAEKFGRLLAGDTKGRSQAVQWVMWQMAGLGPMMGQLNVFRHYFPERLPAVIERYERESYRLFGVLDARLAREKFVAGDAYGIADIASWPWVWCHQWSGLSLAEFPSLQRWYDEVGGRPAVIRGMAVPPPPDLEVEAQTDAMVQDVASTLA